MLPHFNQYTIRCTNSHPLTHISLMIPPAPLTEEIRVDLEVKKQRLRSIGEEVCLKAYSRPLKGVHSKTYKKTYWKISVCNNLQIPTPTRIDMILIFS